MAENVSQSMDASPLHTRTGANEFTGLMGSWGLSVTPAGPRVLAAALCWVLEVVGGAQGKGGLGECVFHPLYP